MENDAGDMAKFFGLAQEDKPSELCYINVHEHPMVLKKSVGVKEMVPWGFNFAGTVVEQVEALTFKADMEKDTLGPLLESTQSLRDMWTREDGGGDMMIQL